MLPRVESAIEHAGLASVCREARCPNRRACYARGAVTYLVLGRVCTRGCPFCGMDCGAPRPPDPHEPGRLAAAVRSSGASRVVLTSVTRDDLPDGGAGHIAACHDAVAAALPRARVELLLPDFGGDAAAVAVSVSGRPAVAGHNVETVPRLFPRMRPGAAYERSLRVLSALASNGLVVRSALMVGLGESLDEVAGVLADLRSVGVSQVVIGQYLPPSARHARVVSYLPPEAFDELRRVGYSLAFQSVLAEPLARSSMEMGSSHAGG